MDGSGVLGRVAYEMTSGVTAGVNISYDEAFETRVSADLKVRFGGPSTTSQRKDVQQLPVINALISSPSYRDVRVHDSDVISSGASYDDCADYVGRLIASPAVRERCKKDPVGMMKQVLFDRKESCKRPLTIDISEWCESKGWYP